MAAARNGPALDQRIIVYQGAGASYTVPISDPDGSRPDLTDAVAAWWLGPMPSLRAQGPQASIANTPGAFTKALPIVADPAVAGAFMVLLDIVPEDYAGFAPGGPCQHEVWITESGKAPYPATLGPFVIHGTVKGAAA